MLVEGRLARRRRRRRRPRPGRRRTPRRARGGVRRADGPRRPTTPRSTRRLPQPRVDALAALVQDEGFDTVLFGARVLAADVAAGLAARLDAGLTGTSSICARGRQARRQAAGARRLRVVDFGWTTEPRLALFRSGSFDPAESGGTADVEDVPAELRRTSRRGARWSSRRTRSRRGPSIEDADVIVAGGRGLGGPENFALVEDLAKALGGAVAATRAVVDAGWYPYATQVGQTGKSVSPKLYIACGISGAIQHKVGMQSSGMIVAINKDANAPIFEFADLGVVGDLHEIVPKLTELVRSARDSGVGEARRLLRLRSIRPSIVRRRPIPPTSGSRSGS